MIKYVEQFLKKYMPSDKRLVKSEIKHKTLNSLDENLNYFKNEFDNSADLTIREFEFLNTKAAIVTIEGMVDKKILGDSVTNPLLLADNFAFENSDELFEYVKMNILATSEQVEITTFEDAFKLSMSGFAVLIIDGTNKMIALGIQGFSFRSIAEPESEVMQKGSKEGFVEAIRVNMSLVRRRIKSPKLKFETMTIGSQSKTDICLCYLTDVVDSQILMEVKKRIKTIDLKYVLSAEYITPYLEQNNDLSFFSSVGISERPDTVCGKISEGRVAILIDGTPNAVIVPYLFVEYFQTVDDYAIRPYFATLTRWLKYLAFIISALLPGLYVALGTFNPEVFPDQLINKMAFAIDNTPFPLVLETLVIHFIYEIMREAGLRLPRALGHAVSIVGALVIGETAVTAGLIGAPTLMVVALTAISSYVIPTLYEPVAILRFIFIIIGGLLGIWGVMLFFAAVLVNICSKSNFSVPFMAPISPFGLYGMRDVLIRAGWKSLSKGDEKIQNMPGSNMNENIMN